jgi:hypothetical protein
MGLLARAAVALALAAPACGGQPAAAPVGAVAVSPVAPPAAGAAQAPAAPAPGPAPTPAQPPGRAHHPARSPFAAGAHGLDASYPQCPGRDRPPARPGFAVVGANGGRGFTTNPCLARQWRTWRPLGLYMNSGFRRDDAAPVGADCRRLGDRLAAPPADRDAYALGCAESTWTLRGLAALGVGPPRTWWIDVESANSWDERDLTRNRFALQGQIDQLAGRGYTVGVYASFEDWRAIAGDWSPARVAADWVARRPPATACAEPGFSRHPVWLVQEDATWPGSGYDSDWAC